MMNLAKKGLSDRVTVRFTQVAQGSNSPVSSLVDWRRQRGGGFKGIDIVNHNRNSESG